METATQGKATCAAWQEHFLIDGVPGGPINLSQVACDEFALRSKIEYTGKTGLENAEIDEDVLAAIRTFDPSRCTPEECTTDLASVPGPTRWFVRSYGPYTPAALMHDRLIPAAESGHEGLTDEQADRYFRFMLDDLGVPWLKRWVMWSAVAMRTRLDAHGAKLVCAWIWMAACVVGIVALGLGLATGNSAMILAAAGAPVVFAGLWGRQYGAGIIPALVAPFLLPPTLFAAVGAAGYRVWAGLVNRLVGAAGHARILFLGVLHKPLMR